jgi:hypothetical protein
MFFILVEEDRFCAKVVTCVKLIKQSESLAQYLHKEELEKRKAS